MSANSNTVNVTFRNHVMPDEQASRTAGRPIFTEMEVCDLSFPANRQTKATYPAHDAEPNATRESFANGGGVVTYAQLYNKQYLAFKDGAAQPLSGTPLAEAPFLKESKRRELKALGIHTVEQLASLDGTPLKQLGMGGRELKNQAQGYLDAAAGSADVTNLAAQVAALTAQLAEERRLREELVQSGTITRNVPAAEQEANQQKDQIDEVDEEEQPDEPPTAEEIEAMDDEELKVYIAKETGSRPRGNPNHDTLVAAAKELANLA
ncbi:hypothetical protein [Mesorhizobium sp.]|uniref:hypothetical protein n=1 Tax=Mesorhizobium sp. TaxID=1871066 RepID=UPI000FE8B986|nr:hypothetical protein [Mesorhizobium sp.]RWG02572.1 MAG: hypothetical protein EOQ54_19660 [Mesorhizobium sp.]RWH00797.1 MAG: hypothetical protein EOQ72_09360 [Mesorhizobium sp.]TIN47590.1 MAG: hypothetical protein E5Y25_05210 [Mesorhizobium sp.]TIR92671.1 MAG: hypothetical protein E5X08_13490 [Mesorhizobium sp.]TIS04240.1 MAG: hypothetical protein E5X13_02275 [Mesorhizobium sp.]